ncbi:L-asparagine permease AnsP1 [Streptomyces bingchenggensis BCW-1]|uniref:L-asparagine permease AnsP1 n=1 Tax=Streptomyces bingchenggensis (strain BCW-1) TaxID=749414 RepID=D7BYI1_STRBB|nr:L-asparagine permease AnsP1 [Streptomyces bingchenggensis BCW-1]
MDTTRADASDDEDPGYRKSPSHRQIQMIGIGGAIGTGLFLGVGGRLASTGPALVFVYAFCGVFPFFILRALGELVLHRPNSGSFVSYAREFFGEKAAYVAGWYAVRGRVLSADRTPSEPSPSPSRRP